MTDRFTFEEGFRLNSTVVVDNREHHVYAIYQRVHGRMYVRCSTPRCPGKAVLSPGLQIKITCAHTHPGDERSIVERRFAATCKKRAVAENTSLKEIYDSEAERLSIDTSKTKFSMRGGGMYRYRRSRSTAANQQTDPANMAEAIAVSPVLRADADGQLWFRGLLGDEDESAGHVLVFASEIYQVLATSTEMHVDITTGCVPALFTHVCTIHAAAFGHVFPCVYALMTQKSPAAFELLFNYLKQTLCPAASPSVVMADTVVSGLTSAINKLFPKARVLSCWFHYTRALWLECVKYGLAEVYETETSISEVLRMAACLPLLPTEHFQACLNVLADRSSNPIVGPGLRVVLTHLDALAESMYGQPRRTGCSVATFAALLQARLGADPDISVFLDRLRKIDKNERIDYQRASKNKAVRAERNNRYLMHDRRVLHATLRLEDGTDTVRQFLSTTGQAVGGILLNIERGSISEQLVQRAQDADDDVAETEEAMDTVMDVDNTMEVTEEETTRADQVLLAPNCAQVKMVENAGETSAKNKNQMPPIDKPANDHEYSLVVDLNAPPRVTFEDGQRKSAMVVVDNLQNQIYSVYQRFEVNGVIRMYLRCCKTHCSGKAVVNGDEIKVTASHSHPGNEENIRQRRFGAACRRRAEQETTSLREIIEAESQRFSISSSSAVNSQRESALYRLRQRNQPENPQAVGELAHLIEQRLRWRLTTDQEEWFRSHLTADDAGDIIVFASQMGLGLLATAEELHIDVIDACVPPMFQCLFTVHGAAFGHVYPCVYALMTHSSPTAFILLMSYLVNTLCPEMNPSTVLLDYDINLTEAVTTVFPKAKVFGTWFHFSRTLWSTYQQHKGASYNPRGNALSFIRMALCLPLLPSTSIQAGLDVLHASLTFNEEQSDEKEVLYILFNHVRDKWVNRVGAEALSVFKNYRRTNNYMEIYRNAMRARMGNQPNVWSFITKLLKVEHRMKTDYKRLSEGKTLKRDYQTKFLLQDKLVLQATSKLEDGSSNVEDFLTAASQSIDYAGTDSVWVSQEKDAPVIDVEAAPETVVNAEVEVPPTLESFDNLQIPHGLGICKGIVRDDSGNMYLLMTDRNVSSDATFVVNSIR